jgi:hypothetical protein
MKSERQSCTYIDEIDRKVRCATKERLLRIIGRFEVTDRDGRPLEFTDVQRNPNVVNAMLSVRMGVSSAKCLNCSCATKFVDGDVRGNFYQGALENCKPDSWTFISSPRIGILKEGMARALPGALSTCLAQH